MLDLTPPMRAVVPRPNGYLRLEDLGVIVDGSTVALVGLDGSIPWLCLPRFDAEPVLCGLLDSQRGGHFTVTAQDLREARQYYLPDTAVLVTEMRTPTGLLQITDAFALRRSADLTDDAPAGRAELVRSARIHRHHRLDAGHLLSTTAEAWRRWMAHFTYAGPQEPLVRRAAITLKLCDDWANGALVAAPTSSLPAPIGGVRNWDYRYAWIRDAAYSVFAMRRIGFLHEADAFLGWVLDAFEQSRHPRIMYTLDGAPVPDEIEDTGLEDYRGSIPVHWGNGAADQRQHDVYGEVLDCADQWVRSGGEIQPALWEQLAELTDAAGQALARTGPGHLGDAQRRPRVHLLGRDVPGGPGPCRRAGRPTRPARPH